MMLIRVALLAAVVLLFVEVALAQPEWDRQYPTGYQPAARKFHSAVPYQDGFVFFGGTNGSVSFNDVFYWDLNENHVTEWAAASAGAAWPAPRHLHAAMATENGFIVHAGHLGAGVAFADDMWEFDCSSKSWTRIAHAGSTVAPRRAAHAAALVNGDVWVYGGTGPDPESRQLPNIGYEDLWKFNLTSLEWTLVAETNEPGVRTGIVGANDDGRSLTFFGGQDMNGNVYGDTKSFDTLQGRWFSSVFDLKPNSFYLGASSNGSYFMYGGTNTEESNNDLWVHSDNGIWYHLSATSYAPPLSGSAGGALEDVFAFFGGANLPGGSVVADFYTYSK